MRDVFRMQVVSLGSDASHRSRLVSRASCLVVLSLLAACSHEPTRAAGTYTVKQGDTLYSIAWRNDVDYHDLAKWNGIGRDYAIHPGEVLRFAPQSKRRAATKSIASTPRVATRATANDGPPIQWSWPVQTGNVTLTTRPNGGQGLTIGGTSGQEIRTAAAGRVVYTGSGLLGYGQLVIVQHNETYLSAYGHTKKVLVHEQEAVQAGQPIATMGEGPNGMPMLYFEIRVDGRPIDPRPLLPK